jgi:hypothetical protein
MNNLSTIAFHRIPAVIHQNRKFPVILQKPR